MGAKQDGKMNGLRESEAARDFKVRMEITKLLSTALDDKSRNAVS